MKTPIIGITTYNDINLQGFSAAMLLRAYIDAIINAGGLPVMIPSGIPENTRIKLLEKLDGLLFTGGGDISIDHYEGIAHPSITNVDEERDDLELQLIRAAIGNDKPFLGICRGLQLLNVVLGGTLFTHIVAQKVDSLKHDYYPNYPRNFLAHKVQILQESKLGKILREKVVEVNSLHHQGIMKLAPQLDSVGFAPDGLVEAVELQGHKFGIAVQWHPEWLTEQKNMQLLFSTFVEASSTSLEK
jgi:putative glutamine amidotransferase